MTIATLFSGIGAPEFAMKNIYGADGFKTVFACEIDKFARQSYLANHKIDEAEFYQDINDLDAKPYLGEVDLLIGGSPCQDFSIAGLRQGISGKRGSLIWQYYRIISECMPKVFIYENVKGMLSDRGGRTLKEFLEVFRNLGYFCHAEVVNTKDYGIPQNRERIYIVGFLDSELYHAFGFAPREPLKLNLGDMLEDIIDKKYFISDKCLAHFRSEHSGFKGRFKPKDVGAKTSNTITTNQGRRKTDNFIKVVGELNIPTFKRARQIYSKSGISPTLLTAKNDQDTPKILQRARGFNKGGEFKICPTVGASSFENNNLLNDGVKIRKLTPRECLRLQGFPDSFKIVVSDTQAYKQAGNAMSVNVVEMIIRRIAVALKATKKEN